jgi:hypothetical protein
MRFFAILDTDVGAVRVRDGDITSIDNGIREITRFSMFKDKLFVLHTYKNDGWGFLNSKPFNAIISQWDFNLNLAINRDELRKDFLELFEGEKFDENCKRAKHYRTGNPCCESEEEGKFLYCTDGVFMGVFTEYLIKKYGSHIELTPHSYPGEVAAAANSHGKRRRTRRRRSRRRRSA